MSIHSMVFNDSVSIHTEDPDQTAQIHGRSKTSLSKYDQKALFHMHQHIKSERLFLPALIAPITKHCINLSRFHK